MSETVTRDWEEANQAYLYASLYRVRKKLEQFLALHEKFGIKGEQPAVPGLEDIRARMSTPPALESLCAIFGLTAFERDVLLMCAGPELDSRFRTVFAALEQGPCLPNFSLALAAFDNPHWSALLPSAPLRHWHLVEVTAADGLTTSPLRIDERILHHLAGTPTIDERLAALTEALSFNGALSQSQENVAAQVAASWSHGGIQRGCPAVQLCGADPVSKRAVAAVACATLGLNLRRVFAFPLPRVPAEFELFVRLWEREALVTPSALLLECHDLEAGDTAVEATVSRFIETLRTPLLISVRERRKSVDREVLWFEVSKPTPAEQLAIWRDQLTAAPALNGSVNKLVAQFSLSTGDIETAAAKALCRFRRTPAGNNNIVPSSPEVLDENDGSGLASILWETCRSQARPRLEGLAQRIESTAWCDDLVLPERQKQLLAQIVLHVRERSCVYDSWGFASKGARGLGISALFAGPSGTGKTMASEVLANELKLDLYRIDLSQIVSKYIGETEKNLRRVFDAADDGAAMLLFDEADALFGKRSEVKDSHDRYANIEVSYLLQRMEAYRGLAILTTNRREALDAAFVRRIRFIIEFPFPDTGLRAEIWRRVFPEQTPTEGLKIDRLARLNAAGGNIRNIALGAAFLASGAREPVRMTHLLQAARNEFAKMEKPLTDLELAGWV